MQITNSGLVRQQAAGCLLQDSLRPSGMRVGVAKKTQSRQVLASAQFRACRETIADRAWAWKIAGDCGGPNLGQGRQGVTMIAPKAGQD